MNQRAPSNQTVRSRAKPSISRTDKVCQACGRTITWRKKWERDWGNIRYCSNACRRRRSPRRDAQLEKSITGYLTQYPGKAISSAELLKLLHATDTQTHTTKAEDVRRAMRRLAHQGRIEVIQQGKRIKPQNIRGEVQVRLCQ